MTFNSPVSSAITASTICTRFDFEGRIPIDETVASIVTVSPLFTSAIFLIFEKSSYRNGTYHKRSRIEIIPIDRKSFAAFSPIPGRPDTGVDKWRDIIKSMVTEVTKVSKVTEGGNKNTPLNGVREDF